jgi:hypothetical protein
VAVFSALAFPLLNCPGSSLCKLVKVLGCAVTLLGSPIKLFGKLAVELGKVDSVCGFCSASLFDGSRTVVIGIVGHQGRTSARLVSSTH